MFARTVTILLLVFLPLLTRAQNISLVGSYKPSQTGYGDVWAEGDIACMGIWLSSGYANGYGVGIFDISNPASPVLVSTYNFGATVKNRFEQGMIRNKILYVGSWGGSGNGGGFHILSLTNPASPVLLSQITKNTAGTVPNGFDDVHTMWLERNFLYEAAHDPGTNSVKVFDVSNPFAPFFVREIFTTNTTKVHQITVGLKAGRTILYTSGWGGFNDGNLNSYGQTDIWDVTDIATQEAQWLGRVYSGYNSHSSWPTPDGNMLIVARETPGGDVSFYDISTPPHPTPSATPNPPPILTINPASMGLEGDIPHNPVIIGNIWYQAWYQNGLQMFDITDRTRPVHIGRYDTYPGAGVTNAYAGNWGIFPHLGMDKILVSDINTGFYILNGTAALTATNNYPPLICTPPTSLTVTQGGNATFTANVTGSSLQFQWKFNGGNIGSATTSTLNLSNVQPGNAGNYSFLANNSLGAVTSIVASLNVVVAGAPPSISSQPQNTSVYAGNPASFSVGVTGDAPFSYQWRRNGANLSSATNSALTVASVQNSDTGSYSIVVTNAYGSVTSTNALLTLIDSPYINSVQATAGTRQALISWNTTIPAAGLVQFGPTDSGTLGLNSYSDGTPRTNHSILLTGLLPKTNYNFQVISAGETNNYISAIYQFSTAGGDIIVDNADASMTYVGTWTSSVNVTGYYGSNYRYANTSASTLRTATFTPQIPATGKYNVYANYSAATDRATNAPYTISYNGGSVTNRVNQQINGGQWNLLGSALPFAIGSSGYVRLANNASNSVVIADAVKWVYPESQDFPTDGTVPAWWSNFYFGTPVNPALDPDGDGYTTTQEYVLGTAPNDPNSHFQVFAQFAGSGARITFSPCLGNRNYQLLYGDSVNAASWQLISPGTITGTPDGHGYFTLDVSGLPQGFYKLAVQMATNGNFSGSFAVPQGKTFSPYAAEAICGPNRAYVR